MVSGALDKISRLCPPPRVTDHRTTASSYLCSSFFDATSLGALDSCPSRLPLDPPLFYRRTPDVFEFRKMTTSIVE